MSRLVHCRNWLLLIWIGCVAAAIPIAARLGFDQSIDSFFASDHPDLIRLHHSRDDFGGDEFVIIAWPQPNVITRANDRELPELAEDAHQRIESLVEQLNALPGINPERTSHLIHFVDDYPRLRPVREKILTLLQGVLISEDEQTTAVVVELRPEQQSPEPRAVTIRHIREIAGTFHPQAAVAGEAVQIHEMFSLVRRDGNRLYLVSLIILTATLFIIFRSPRWVLAAMLIVVGSVVCARATLVLSGVSMSMVSSMLNSLVTVISVATSMHVLVHYRDLRREANAPESTTRTLREMIGPVFWTCATTATGFLSLLVSDIEPVRMFAITMALATSIVFAGTIMVMPAAMRSGRSLAIPTQAPLEGSLNRLLNGIVHLIDQRPRRTGFACLLVVAITAPGFFQLQVDTDFSHNFRRSSGIVRSLQFIEAHLGPAGTWDVSFDVPEPLTADFLAETGILTDQLSALRNQGLDIRILSLNDAIDLPPRTGTTLARLDRITRREGNLVRGLYNAERHRMRIVLRSREQQTAEEKLSQITQVRNLVDDYLRAADAEADRPTTATTSGLFILLAQLIDSLLEDQMKSFLVAATGILLLMTIAFRSLKTGIACLIPNVFPVVIVIGSLGMLGIRVNIGTAMIAAVSLGLTVDSTIHYVTAFQRARLQHSFVDSIRIAHNSAGRAVVLANVALVVGFLVLTVSEFIPLVYFGALLSLSMISGVFGGLVLLPLLLRWTDPGTCPAIADPAADSSLKTTQQTI
ncbi:MAG: MMPL family transporter [Planctomycetaceae bacterium]|nr:MMPL family transporter [Planctomycetaceae bacterium]